MIELVLIIIAVLGVFGVGFLVGVKYYERKISRQLQDVIAQALTQGLGLDTDGNK